MMMMTTATRKVIAEHNGYELVAYQTGEKRIEHAASKTASDWLYHTDVDAIKESPDQMGSWALDYNLDSDAE